MDQASEIGTTPDVDQDAALLCSVSDQMHLDAHQKASVCAPHPSRGRFRSSATTARCRVIGESSTKDSERDSRKLQSSFFTNERLSHKQQRSPSYVLQVGVSVRKTGSVSAHPVSLLHALQSSLCAITSQTIHTIEALYHSFHQLRRVCCAETRIGQVSAVRRDPSQCKLSLLLRQHQNQGQACYSQSWFSHTHKAKCAASWPAAFASAKTCLQYCKSDSHLPLQQLAFKRVSPSRQKSP